MSIKRTIVYPKYKREKVKGLPGAILSPQDLFELKMIMDKEEKEKDKNNVAKDNIQKMAT